METIELGIQWAERVTQSRIELTVISKTNQRGGFKKKLLKIIQLDFRFKHAIIPQGDELLYHALI